MDKIKVLNDLKALEMKQRHIQSIMDDINNPFEGNPVITVKGVNVKVGVNGLNAMLQGEMKKTKIEYDDTLKSLIDDEGGF